MKRYDSFARLFQKGINQLFSLYAPNSKKWDAKGSYRFTYDGMESKVGKDKWESWDRDMGLILKSLLEGKLVVVSDWKSTYKVNMAKLQRLSNGKYDKDTPVFSETHIAYVKKLLKKLPVQPDLKISPKDEPMKKHICLIYIYNDSILEFRIYEDKQIWVWTIGSELSDAGQVTESEMLEYIKDFYS